MPSKKTESHDRRAFTPNKRLFFLIIGFVLIAFSLWVLYGFISQWETRESNAVVSGMFDKESENGPDLVYEGAGYNLKDDIETTLVMGIDTFQNNEADKDKQIETNPTQSDFLTLIVTNKKTGQSRLLQLNRDTMVDVDVLGTFNDVVRTDTMQLALAHSYGSGERDSARNTMRSVSRLLKGVPIDHFVTLTMDAVATVNDAIGGVPVYIDEDFSGVDSTLVKGETINLMGDQALHYVRGRKSVDDGTNMSRMERQRKYLTAFYDKLGNAIDDGSVSMTTLLTKVSPYMESDLSINKLSDLLSDALKNAQPEIEVIEGTNKMGEKYIEFYPDEDALTKEVISLFFDPVKEDPKPGQNPTLQDVSEINGKKDSGTDNN